MMTPTKPVPDHPPSDCVRCSSARRWGWRKKGSRWEAVCNPCKAKSKRKSRKQQCEVDHMPASSVSNPINLKPQSPNNRVRHMGHRFDPELGCSCGIDWWQHQTLQEPCIFSDVRDGRCKRVLVEEATP